MEPAPDWWYQAGLPGLALTWPDPGLALAGLWEPWDGVSQTWPGGWPGPGLAWPWPESLALALILALVQPWPDSGAEATALALMAWAWPALRPYYNPDLA
jgi:hypothetical protein